MKFAPLAALGLALAAVTAPAAVVAQDTATPAPAFTIDTPIETLMADERAKAVLTANFGGQDLSQHPAYDQFKALSLKALAPFSQGLITEEMLAKIGAELAAIK
ncbi:hypothetical protein [Erythrobacter sp. CCH5-A1]|jgi:hypothetical protein|uniref:hypothetical protein n=1 Tax=Erythrobacter sp. CCH5-A1 TaxID=1768792 RepID=UPI0008373EA3|nr:hypothetical protein [Erythrobacter sp. CCH5-A1]